LVIRKLQFDVLASLRFAVFNPSFSDFEGEVFSFRFGRKRLVYFQGLADDGSYLFIDAKLRREAVKATPGGD
jgi:hypothetical protein